MRFTTTIAALLLTLASATAHAGAFECKVSGAPGLNTVELPVGDTEEQEYELGTARADDGMAVSLRLVLMKRERSRDKPSISVRFSKVESGGGAYITLPLGGADSRADGSIFAWLNVGNALVSDIGEYRLPQPKRFESAKKYRQRLVEWMKTRPEASIRAGLAQVVEVYCRPEATN